MTFPYMLQRIKRRPVATFLLLGLNFIAALLLCLLHISSNRLNCQIDSVYENAVITCQVSNLTGTQTDDLRLPEWIIRIFLGKENVPNSSGVFYSDEENAAKFRSYISDVYVKVSVKGKLQGSNVEVVGITSLKADRALQEEFGCYIDWKEPFDETIFSGADAYCIVPKSLLSAFTEQDSIVLSFKRTGQEPVTKEFLIVGTHTGKDNTIYCPWSITTEINQEIDGTLHADSITAVLSNSRSVPVFWENAACHYFVEPNAKGELTVWEESHVYDYFPYALLVNDDMLEETVSELQNNLLVFRLCTVTIVVLSLILGFVVGHLIVRQRTKTLALQRILGQSNGNIFAETYLELTSVTAAGIITGIGTGWLIGIKDFPWDALATSFVFYTIGIASAVCSILRTDLIRSAKEDA